MLASIAQQQRSGVDELRGRRRSAVRECFQPAAFFFGKGNLISGCHAPIIHQQKSAVNMRNVTCYIVLVCTTTGQPWASLYNPFRVQEPPAERAKQGQFMILTNPL